MTNWVLAAGWTAFSCLGAGALGFVLTSISERRWRAVHVSTLLFTPILGVRAQRFLCHSSALAFVLLDVQFGVTSLVGGLAGTCVLRIGTLL